jgi:sporulation protein YlmC with PRC-barrel domain
MHRIIIAVALVLIIFGLGFVSANAYATENMSKSWHRAYETNGLIGTPVENPLGETVGSIEDFVIDSNGHVDFVILTHDFYWEYVPEPSQTVAVPFNEVVIRPHEKIYVLKFSAWKLDFAPKFEKSDINHRKWSESVYRYFGLHPYWTEGGHKASMDPHRWGGEAQDF